MTKKFYLKRWANWGKNIVSLLFLAFSLVLLGCNCRGKCGSPTNILTIASIAKSDDGKSNEIRFYQRQLVYITEPGDALDKFTSHFDFKDLKGMSIKVVFDQDDLTIKSVAKLTMEEMNAFSEKEKHNTKEQTATPVDLNTIDTTTFNIVCNLQMPAAERGGRVVPNLETAQNIFNYCAKQSCDSNDNDIKPCIPFQYILEGCGARANKMCQAISKKYPYNCAKVFSIETNKKHQLSVQVTKWGGCCFPDTIFWWWHVAPMIEVQVDKDVLAYVIDPGMFYGPVKLSTWLMAQENPNCLPKPSRITKLDTYCIQPMSSYEPAHAPPVGGNNFTFSTDRCFCDTDSTLRQYQNRQTCPK